MHQPTPPAPGSGTFRADVEHGGIQFAVPLIMLAAGILTFVLIDRLVLHPVLGGGPGSDLRPFLRLVLSIVLAVSIGGGAEALLKRWWSSGRYLKLDPQGLIVQNKEQPPMRIDWDRRVNILRWRYSMQGYPRGGRERRVPTGHYLLACRLLQDDTVVIIHSFMPPNRAESVPNLTRYAVIEIATLFKGGLLNRMSYPDRPSIPADLLSGKQGQVWAAERERWVTGMELEPKAFVALTQVLEQRLPATLSQPAA